MNLTSDLSITTINDRKVTFIKREYLWQTIQKREYWMLAFTYTTPISALVHLCDREPEKTEDDAAAIGPAKRIQNLSVTETISEL